MINVNTTLHYAASTLIICVALGCQQLTDGHTAVKDDELSEQGAATQLPTDAENSLAFAGRKWGPAGPCQSTGDIFRPYMSAVQHTTTEDNIRLVELVFDESTPIKEGVFSRILGVQIKRNGRWISHGPRAEWDLNGGRAEIQYVNGELHGTQRHWYPNGQLHIEREWAYGKEHGRDRGWHPNGNPQYDSHYVNGDEVSGKAWDENGKPE